MGGWVGWMGRMTMLYRSTAARLRLHEMNAFQHLYHQRCPSQQQESTVVAGRFFHSVFLVTESSNSNNNSPVRCVFLNITFGGEMFCS